MDEEEIEDWFATHKEELDKEFKHEIGENLSDPTPVKEKYDKKYRDLIRKYQKMQLNTLKSKRRSERLHKPIDKLNGFVQESLKKVKTWYSVKRKQIEKWAFDLKFRWTVLK